MIALGITLASTAAYLFIGWLLMQWDWRRLLVNTVNRPIPLELAHKLRSAAQALLADAANQPAPLASALMQEAAAIQCRADALEKDAKQVEPTEFGSIVRAGRGDSVRALWQPTTFHGRHYWMSEFGIVEVWSELTDVEVLRVGLGEPERDGFCTCHGNERALDCGISAHRNEARIYRDPMADEPEAERADVAPEETEDYKAGVSDTVFKIHGRLQNLLDGAITSERKNALEKAIQAVEELAP